MKKKDLTLSYPGFFVSELRGDALWLRFSGNFFHNFLSFDQGDFLHDVFIRIAGEPAIRAVVIHSEVQESGSDEYLRFFLLECPTRDLGHFGFSNTMNRYELHRFCNMIDQTVLDIVSLKKMVIHICSGDVLSLFMNISLACDYRIVASNTVFHNIFQEIGMLPKGGAPFFLSKNPGPAKAKNLLLLKPRITAEEALQNGIADQVVPPEHLEDAALAIVRTYREIPDQTLSGVKKLVNHGLKDLQAYLACETEEILKLAHREGFGEP